MSTNNNRSQRQPYDCVEIFGALQIKMNPGKIMYSVCKEGYLTLLCLYSSLPDDPQVEWNTKLVGRIIADHIKINRIEVVSISLQT